MSPVFMRVKKLGYRPVDSLGQGNLTLHRLSLAIVAYPPCIALMRIVLFLSFPSQGKSIETHQRMV